MKKFLPVTLLLFTALLLLPACNKEPDYFEYVSEYRKSVYYYEDDGFEVRIYSVVRETPYSLDGIKGELQSVTEIYFNAENTPTEVLAELNGEGGEMSYLSVTKNFYMSFDGGELKGAKLPVKFTVDGKLFEFEVNSVAEEGTIDGRTALKCVIEYDRASFETLTDGTSFAGEIGIRLLYDEGCFYYVGLCDRSGSVHAYLVDGADGRVIAERS